MSQGGVLSAIVTLRQPSQQRPTWTVLREPRDRVVDVNSTSSINCSIAVMNELQVYGTPDPVLANGGATCGSRRSHGSCGDDHIGVINSYTTVVF